MLKRILSFAIVLSLTFATGIGVYGTETEFTLPVSGELMSDAGSGGAVTGIGQTPKSNYSQSQSNPSSGSSDNTTSDNSVPIVEENATKYNKMMNEHLSSSVAPSKYQSRQVASAPDISGTKFEEAAEVLGALGIMVGDKGTGNFRPDDDIKRSEMAKVAVYSSGLEDVANNSNSPSRFPDVSSKHWALGAINVADSQGMVIGDTNGRFRPNDSVSFQEAVTIIVRAMGYEPVAQANGGFPGGYMYVASTNQLLKGISSNAKSAATRGDVAQLVFNALTVNLMEQTGYGTNISYEVVDKTLLLDKLNVEKGYGQVTGTSETTLNGGNTVAEDRIQINNEVFIEGTSGAKQLLGHNVVYYARIDATSDEKTVIVVRSQASKNNTLTLNSDDITATGGTTADGITITYSTENMSNPKTVTTVSNPVFIYNGKYDTQITPENLKINSGNLILLDTDVNNVYDIVFVNEFTNIVVDTVSTVTGRVTDKYNGTSIVLDPEEETVQYTLIKDGVEIQTSDLEEWNVISYTTSRDKELIRGYVTDESVSGTVTQISSNGAIRFNDETTSYKVAKSYPNEIKIRDTGRFYLDYEGKIAAVDKSATTSDDKNARELYGYLVNAAETGTLDTDVQFKIFTEKGETNVYGSANRIRLNGTYGITPAEVLGTIAPGGTVTPQLITFRTNADDKITSINTAFDNTATGAPNTEKFTLNISKQGMIYKSSSSKLGDVTIDPQTIIFDIPANAGTDTDKYAVRKKSMFTNDGSYDVKIYDLAESYTAGIVVVTNSTGIASAEAPIVLVDELAEAQNEEYEAIDVLYGLSEGKNVTINGSSTGVFIKNNQPLTRGDIIQYSTNTKGEADEIQLLFNVDEKTTEFTRDVSTDLKTVYGRVTKKFAKSVNVDVNGSVTNYATDDATVYLFDSTRGEGKVSVVAPEDIEVYEEGNEARIFIKLYRDTVQEIVIIK
ncbi:MAG: S-layer homology domain-containing protein [Ruminococcaceae bacterium]|nr:S-layer homology domain-containing protein [Oscillospiraceae bacterium]